MQSARGLGIAFALFAGSFALHIVGGASDQRWLFAIAVGLIYLTATGFPAITVIASGRATSQRSQMKLVLALASIAGVGLTIGALWAANGRAFAWWQFVLGPVLVLVSSAAVHASRRFASQPAKAVGAS